MLQGANNIDFCLKTHPEQEINSFSVRFLLRDSVYMIKAILLETFKQKTIILQEFQRKTLKIVLKLLNMSKI